METPKELSKLDKAIALVCAANVRAQKAIDESRVTPVTGDDKTDRLLKWFFDNPKAFEGYRAEVGGLLEAMTGIPLSQYQIRTPNYGKPEFRYAMILCGDKGFRFVDASKHAFFAALTANKQFDENSNYDNADRLEIDFRDRAATPEEVASRLSNSSERFVAILANHYDEMMYFASTAPGLVPVTTAATPAEVETTEQEGGSDDHPNQD